MSVFARVVYFFSNTELAALRMNYTKLRETVGSNVPYFASVFFEKGFISREAKNEIPSIHGVGGRGKADKLLEEVCSHLKSATDKESRFHEFTAIFSVESAYQDLVQSLKASYSGKIICLLSLSSPW